MSKNTLLSIMASVKTAKMLRWIRKHGVSRNLDAIRPNLELAAQMLGVDLPAIQLVPYMVDYAGDFMVFDAPCHELEQGDPALGRYISDDLVLVGCYDPVTYEELADAEILVICLHELRHMHQHTYQPEIYGKTNTWGIDSVYDISEIDADAWAMAYMHTFTSYHPEEYTALWRFTMLFDGGLRLKLAEEMRREMAS